MVSRESTKEEAVESRKKISSSDNGPTLMPAVGPKSEPFTLVGQMLLTFTVRLLSVVRVRVRLTYTNLFALERRPVIALHL